MVKISRFVMNFTFMHNCNLFLFLVATFCTTGKEVLYATHTARFGGGSDDNQYSSHSTGNDASAGQRQRLIIQLFISILYGRILLQ